MRVLAIYAILLIPLAAAEDPTVVGLSGQWTRDDGTTGKSQEVHFGQSVPKGAKLSGRKGDHIVIQCDGAFDNQSCPATKGCHVEVCARQTAEAGSDKFQWLTSSVTLISRSPDRFITAVTRGLGPEPWEAVVEMNGDQVNLAPALANLADGKYRLKITNLPQNPAFAAEHAIQWSPGGVAGFAVPGIQPGVYSMVIMEGPGDIQGAEAWLLVTAGPMAASLLQTWEQVKESIAPWREDVEAPYLHAFLRATLVALFESNSKLAAGK